MRVTEDRYSRDLRRINLAQQLIRHEVRTAAIRLWTGLSGDRVRKLMRSYTATAGEGLRHRGPPPTSIAEFMRSTPLGSEASAMTALALLFHVVPPRKLTQARRDVPNVEAGERICRAFDLYRRIVPYSRLTLEQSMLLTIAVAEGAEARLGHCVHCFGALLIDPNQLTREICYWCRRHEGSAEEDTSEPALEEKAVVESPSAPGPGVQQSLF